MADSPTDIKMEAFQSTKNLKNSAKADTSTAVYIDGQVVTKSNAEVKLAHMIEQAGTWSTIHIESCDLIISDLNEFVMLQNYRKHMKQHMDVLTQNVVKGMKPPTIEPKKKGIFSKK
jgi:ribosomal protein S25